MSNDTQVRSFRPSVHRILFPLAISYVSDGLWKATRAGEAGRIVLTGDGQGDSGARLGWETDSLPESVTSLQSDGVPSQDEDSDFVVEDVGFEPMGGGYFTNNAVTGNTNAKLVTLPGSSNNIEPGESEFRDLRDRLFTAAFRTGLLGFQDRGSSKCSVTLGTPAQFSSGLGSYGVEKQGTLSLPTAAARAGQIADSVAGLRLSGKDVKDRIGFYVELGEMPVQRDTAKASGTPPVDPHPLADRAFVVPVMFTMRGHYEDRSSARDVGAEVQTFDGSYSAKDAARQGYDDTMTNMRRTKVDGYAAKA